MTPKAEVKKTLEKSDSKKGRRGGGRGEKSSSSSGFDDIYNGNYIVPSTRSRRINGDEITTCMLTTSTLNAMIQKIDKVEESVDRVEGRLSKLEQSYLEIEASISIMNAAIESLATKEAQEAKIGKINTLKLIYCLYIIVRCRYMIP